MKNIYLIPTDKPTVLGRFIDTSNLFLRTDNDIPRGESVELYITSDEEIKDRNCWVTNGEDVFKPLDDYSLEYANRYWKKIILTTDQELIKNGVQAIDNEFLGWFVNNPSCEEVEVSYEVLNPFQSIDKGYVLRLPDIANVLEEPNQETLEEVIKREYEARKFNSNFPFDPQSFKLGAKWEAKRRYSEEDMIEFALFLEIHLPMKPRKTHHQLLEQFKTK